MRFLFFIAGLALTLAVLPRLASAHPIDVAYADVSISTSSVPLLTVAVHPYQAFELVRGDETGRFDLAALQQNGALISAYVQDHVTVQRDGQPCRWRAEDAHTPDTELDAVADGVTIAGPFACPGPAFASAPGARSLQVASTVFLDGFPNQTTIVRLEFPDGFADRFTLDRVTRSGTLDLSPLFIGVASSDGAESARRPDAPLLQIASRLLDPGMGWAGSAGLLFAAALIGMLHALGPGHGKSLLAAVLVGERATASRAVALASVMAATHVADVFLMALLAGVISATIPPTQLLSALERISAAGLIVLGLFSLARAIRRYRMVRRNPDIARQENDVHARMHALGVGHGHAEDPHDALALAALHASRPSSADVSALPLDLVQPLPFTRPSPTDVPHDHHAHDRRSFRQALWMGFVGSLAPCPTAWAMFLAMLSVGRIGAGITLLVAFSVGLYATVVAVGLLIVISKRFALRRTPAQLTYALPILSAGVVTMLGMWLAWQQWG